VLSEFIVSRTNLLILLVLRVAENALCAVGHQQQGLKVVDLDDGGVQVEQRVHGHVEQQAVPDER